MKLNSKQESSLTPDWNGQNIPIAYTPEGYTTCYPIPIMICIIDCGEEGIENLLPSMESYGWGDEMTNTFAWANNYYKINVLIPDFERYGCLPGWFPKTDLEERRITPQAQVNRFLYLIDRIFGLPDDHRELSAEALTYALFELWNDADYFWELDDISWELDTSEEDQ